MASYLGLYIESHLIKYAKVTKEKDKIKIDSFGIKFYNNLSQAINQIVEETYSFNTPISVNLAGESYQYFSMFSQLNKKDLDKAIKLEYDTYCTEKGFNSNSMEQRYSIVNNIVDDGKLRVINISQNKIELTKIKTKLGEYKLNTISPVSMTIPTIASLGEKEKALIVNIEEDTTITTIIDRNIYEITKIEQGSKEILEKINMKENSYAKAYEILRNTTIYTSDTQDFVEEESRYLEDIMPTLYSVVGNVQKIINENIQKIDKVYITGTLSCVNNIDLYFQEYLDKVQCEILKPYFVQNLAKDVNLKEYIEVNSAISLALQGLGEGIKGINFKSISLLEKAFQTVPITKSTRKEKNTNIKLDDFKEKFTKPETWLLRSSIAVLLFIIIYSTFSSLLVKQIETKQKEVDKVTTDISMQISKIQKDTQNLNQQVTQYTEDIKKLKTVNDKISEINASKNLIPNLLNQIMQTIDENVQIKTIENTTDKHIVIIAQSEKYQGLGYFKTKLQTKNILNNVVAGSSMKNGSTITVTIEGDLP